jgi:hypothetical protein
VSGCSWVAHGPKSIQGGQPCERTGISRKGAFERSSKRRKGYPSETRVKRGQQVVHGDKELVEKLGRKDLCPCGSGRRFQALLLEDGTIRRQQPRLFSSGSNAGIRGGDRKAKQSA